MPELTLADVLEVAGEDAALAPPTVELDGSVTFAVGSVLIATLDPAAETASFRLDPVLAGAARRTPDVFPSALGPEWVTFRPALLDDHAIDRAEAWFAAAVRRATIAR